MQLSKKGQKFSLNWANSGHDLGKLGPWKFAVLYGYYSTKVGKVQHIPVVIIMLGELGVRIISEGMKE